HAGASDDECNAVHDREIRTDDGRGRSDAGCGRVRDVEHEEVVRAPCDAASTADYLTVGRDLTHGARIEGVDLVQKRPIVGAALGAQAHWKWGYSRECREGPDGPCPVEVRECADDCSHTRATDGASRHDPSPL